MTPNVMQPERFRPAAVFHPSEYIAEEAIARGWDEWDLARHSGAPEAEWPRQVLAWRLYASGALSPDLMEHCYMGGDGASDLGRAFGMDPDFWLALESYWRTNIDRHAPMTDKALRDWYGLDDEVPAAPMKDQELRP